jgi:hypothetical protein
MKLTPNSTSILILLATAGVAASSCGKKKSKDEAYTVSSVADMKLSSSFNLSLPSGFSKASGQSTNLTLADGSMNLAGKRSSEACRTIQQADSLFSNLGSIAGMMCHLEAESAQFKFGVKYLVKLTQGGSTQDMPLWVDNSTAGSLTMYTCKNGSIAEKIVIGSATSSGPKGTINFRGSEGGNSYASALEFDFTTGGLKILKGQNTFSNSSDNYASDTSIELRDSGVSAIKMSNRGTSSSFGTFSDRGAVKFNGTLGQAVFKGSGSGGSQTYSWSSRATFDSDGFKVDNATATDDIKLDFSEVPAALASGFAVETASGWDCKTDETISVDTDNGSTAAAHKACERDHSSNFQCFGADFEQGTAETLN